MAVKAKAVEQEDIAVSDVVLVAPNTEFEREIKLKLPRGKHGRGVTPVIIQSIEGLEVFSTGEGDVSIKDVGNAMQKMMQTPGYQDKLVPIAFGLMDMKTGQVKQDDADWMDMITDIELFQAYVHAALYIATNGQTDQAQAAVKN